MLKLKYVPPNAATAVNLFLGFWSVIESMQGNYQQAMSCILFGILVDMCDGALSRLFRATSAFGKEFDSLADLTVFGIAPSVLLYQRYGGMYLSFPPTLCAAIRLARFNIHPPISYSVGLPAPAAAALILGYLMISDTSTIDAGIVIGLICGLMVSNIHFPRSIGWLRHFKRRLPVSSPQLLHDPRRGQ